MVTKGTMLKARKRTNLPKSKNHNWYPWCGRNTGRQKPNKTIHYHGQENKKSTTATQIGLNARNAGYTSTNESRTKHRTGEHSRATTNNRVVGGLAKKQR